jgi:hypothetical protein
MRLTVVGRHITVSQNDKPRSCSDAVRLYPGVGDGECVGVEDGEGEFDGDFDDEGDFDGDFDDEGDFDGDFDDENGGWLLTNCEADGTTRGGAPVD